MFKGVDSSNTQTVANQTASFRTTPRTYHHILLSHGVNKVLYDQEYS